MPTGQIAALVRDECKAAGLKAQGADVRVGSCDDIGSLDRAMQGIEKVLLISGTEKDRVRQHQNVINAAKRAEVRLIVYTSRIVKNQDPSRPLMAGHFATEDSLKNSGLPYVLLRNAPYMDVIPQFIGGEKVFETGIPLPAGDGKVSFALRSELGEATANLLTEEDPQSRTYELTAGEAWSYYDIANALTEISGWEVTYTPLEKPEFEARMRGRGVPEPAIQMAFHFRSEVRNGLLNEVSTEMERLLRRKPVSLQKGLTTLFSLQNASHRQEKRLPLPNLFRKTDWR